jgi:hypothetical protein
VSFARVSAVVVVVVVTAALWGPGLSLAQGADTAEAMHVVDAVRGDTLIGLAQRYLAEPKRWPEMARANALRNPNRLAIGDRIRIPLRLMRTEPVPATVVSVTGNVSGGAAATPTSSLQAGQTVPEGGEVVTGPDGHVTIRLVDGTLLRLRPDSRLLLRESNRLRDAEGVRSGARLKSGRVEVEAAPAPPGRPGFSVDTPQGVLGVRGTEFRVSVNPAASGGSGGTGGEVLGGAVAFTGQASPAGERVGAGFGTLIGPRGDVDKPVPLLPALPTDGLPTLQERLLMRFALPTLPGAAAYHGQIARDAAFDQVVADLVSPGPELRFAELPDGDYILRVRGIDGKGLEGLNANHPFRLKARPEAPLPSAPAPRATLIGNRAELAWTNAKEARSYRLRVSNTADFKTILRDVADLRTASTVLEGLSPGVYFWQLASARAPGEGGRVDQGPWGDVNSFEIRPPAPVSQPPRVSDKAINFVWAGLPGQTFDFEVARDAPFSQLVLQRSLNEPSFELVLPLPAPSTGRFYVRLRAIDADGYVGPFGSAQFFDIEAKPCWRDGSGECVRAGDQTLNTAP